MPKISFFEKLLKVEAIAEIFPIVETNRLWMKFKDYQKHQNLMLSFERIAFEADRYNKSEEKKVIKLLDDHFDILSQRDSIIRYGHRFWVLVPTKMTFKELNSIVKLKFFAQSFWESISKNVRDTSIVIVTEYEDIELRIKFGPVLKKSARNLIKFNHEDHLDPNSSNPNLYLGKIYEKYPDLALYMDIDIYKIDPNGVNMMEFYNKSVKACDYFVKKISEFTFQNKL